MLISRPYHKFFAVNEITGSITLCFSHCGFQTVLTETNVNKIDWHGVEVVTKKYDGYKIASNACAKSAMQCVDDSCDGKG